MSWYLPSSSTPHSIEDESVLAVIVVAAQCVGLAGDAVNAVEAAEENRLRISRISKAVVRLRQLLLRHGANNVRSDEHHQLGLVVDVVAAPEQRTLHGNLLKPRQPVDRLLRLLLNHTGHRQGTTGRNFNHRIGTAGLN